MTIINLAVKLILLIGSGFAARKLKIMPDGFDRMLTKFTMAIPLPCMIISSFMLEFSLEELLNFPVVLSLAVVTMALSFAIGEAARRIIGGGPGKAARFALLFTNFTFFGLAVVSELYGAQAVFYFVTFTLLIRIAFYGGAPLLLGSGGHKLDVKQTVKQFINEPVVAVFIGLFLYITQLRLPVAIESTIQTLGAMASPLGLMLCGAIIADAKLKGVLKYPSVIIVSLMRLILIPAVVLGFLMLVGVDELITKTIVFYFAMPAASFMPAFFLRYNPEDTEGRAVSGYLVVTSTILSVATIPVWAMAMEKLLG